MDTKAIVTGGSGMVGSALKSVLPQAEYISRDQFHNLSYDIRGKHVILLAAKVGGVMANTDYIAYDTSIAANDRIKYYLKCNISIRSTYRYFCTCL